MIKWARIVIVVVFIATLAVFSYVKVTTRMMSDVVPPVITAETDEITVSVDAIDEDLMEGMQATDNMDGDVTDSMFVVSRSRFIRPGVCNVKYAAFDSHNNVTSYTRRVTYEGYHSPEFHVEKPLVYSMNERNVDYLENIHVTDLLDGDITPLIRMTSGVQQTEEDGSISMPLTLEVVNSSGDASKVELTVRYLDSSSFQTAAPALTKYIAYTDVGTELDSDSFLNGVRFGREQNAFAVAGYSTKDITIEDSNVDYNTPGVYTIYYFLHPHLTTDSEEKSETPDELISLGTTELVVVVR